MTLLSPIATLNDNGRGVSDLQAALAAAAETTNTFYNSGDIITVIHNGDSSSKTATMKAAVDPYGRGGSADTNNDEVLTIPAGETGIFPFLNPAAWNTGGLATFVLSAITSVKIGIYKVVKLR